MTIAKPNDDFDDIFGVPSATAARVASVKEFLARSATPEQPAMVPTKAAPDLITEPGIYQMTNESYHAHPAISNSYLSRLDKCPAAAKVPQVTTAAMTFGSAAHCYILEGELAFFAQYAVPPKCDKRTTAGKSTWADFIAANPDRELIDSEDFALISDMSEAVHAHPFAAKLLESGKAEQSFFWTDPATGLPMKCRPDWQPEVGDVLVDLKTTADASEHAFTRSITGYGYHRQAAIYLDGAAAVGVSADAFIFIAVEKSAPHRVEVYILADDFVDAGRADYRRILDLEQACWQAQHYPHFTNPEITEISKPAWMSV